MRLLCQESDGTYSLTKFDSSEIPPYTILSHTWGPDHEEVIFPDLNQASRSKKTKRKGHMAERKKGFEKLDFCAKQTAKDNLKYFWIDTCCIDKSSSEEITESINSMFRYYERAEKCYVYLPDVKLAEAGLSTSPRSWKHAFRSSRWFTRGWTLQELLAPKRVEFFSFEGLRIGERASLIQDIHAATASTLPISVLDGQKLSQFSPEERISWIAERNTKREEDKAYALQGILGVSMPTIYGEGYEKAFTRLRKALPADADANVSANAPTLPSTIPFRRDEDFVMRDCLDKLHQICARPAGCAALVGLGGVG